MTTKSATFKDRLRYWFDNFMAKGTAALIASLGVISLIIILIVAGVVYISGIGPGDAGSISFLEAVWLSMMRTLDAGTMGADEGWRFRLAMFIVTLGGVFVISTLIGVLTSGIEGKLEELRKGRSKVIESGHTVILGWSPQIFPIISELIVANANQAKACIVILGDKDKVEMEEEILSDVENKVGHTRIVCRTGSPIDLNDLELVSIHSARSIIILSGEGRDPDAATIKSILAITNNPNRREKPYHIVADIRDARNLDVAKMVGKDEVELVLTSSLISRIIAQTCRQSGLSVIYTELLDFGGDEIYFKEEPGLVGKAFREALLAYKDSAVIGLFPQGASPSLNPPMDTIIQAGDQVIAISQDDDTVIISDYLLAGIQESLLATPQERHARAERTLILGWNSHAPQIIQELDQYVTPGSTVTVVSSESKAQEEFLRLAAAQKNQNVLFQTSDTTDRRTLDLIQAATFDHIILLCYGEQMDTQEADAITLITLLHLRDIAQKSGQRLSIVSEMLDIRNRILAEVTQADDFIVSDKIVSLMLSQISENKHLNAVFTDIFDPEGSEIYLKPAADYVTLGVPVNFYTVVESACRRGEVAFGYRIKALSGDAGKAYGVVVNPDKPEKITFTEEDRIVVLAEE